MRIDGKGYNTIVQSFPQSNSSRFGSNNKSRAIAMRLVSIEDSCMTSLKLLWMLRKVRRRAQGVQGAVEALNFLVHYAFVKLPSVREMGPHCMLQGASQMAGINGSVPINTLEIVRSSGIFPHPVK